MVVVVVVVVVAWSALLSMWLVPGCLSSLWRWGWGSCFATAAFSRVGAVFAAAGRNGWPRAGVLVAPTNMLLLPASNCSPLLKACLTRQEIVYSLSQTAYHVTPPAIHPAARLVVSDTSVSRPPRRGTRSCTLAWKNSCASTSSRRRLTCPRPSPRRSSSRRRRPRRRRRYRSRHRHHHPYTRESAPLPPQPPCPRRRCREDHYRGWA